jgi:methionine synthase I (cobalamin-dependent)/5,10-methylenetetrahydrofolate reductase
MKTSGGGTEFLRQIGSKVFLCDGGMGTMLYNKGVYLNTCFDELNLSRGGIIREIHDEYIRSGAEIIETNTFGANRYKLKKFGLEDMLSEINRMGARIAREAAGEGAYVAGSIGPLGIKIEPWGPTSMAEAEQAFREQGEYLLDGGVDFIILETFADINEIHQAIKALKSIDQRIPVVAQMTISEDGNSLYGTTPEVFTRQLEEWGADVLGLNCSVGPAFILQGIEKMAKLTNLPLSAMPNAGIPRAVEGRNIYLCSPEYMAEYTKRLILNGVKLVGGCCGTTPRHIKAMRGAVKALQPPAATRVTEKPAREEQKAVRGIPREKKSGLAGKLVSGEFAVSVEIVPPRGHSAAGAIETAKRFKESGVDCVNIPDGPRASARMSAMVLAFLINRKAGIEPLLHYTCRDRNLLGMQSDLLGVYAEGIKNILVVTGDPPKLGDYPDATAVFDVDSIGLTNVVRTLNHGLDIGRKKLAEPTGFYIGVAANPGAINLDYEISRFEWKVEAGAEFAITQPVFDLGLLERFLDRIRHCRIPVMAGIWPLLSLRNAEFMHNEVPGARVPDDVMARMRKAQEKGPEFAREEGVLIAGEVLRHVRGMVEGVQISPPLGRIEPALQILDYS